MATTPEEFFVKGLMEQSQPPLLEKSSGMSEGCQQHVVPNDMMLPYISHMLLEDDIDDNELNDHPALLQVQQPFAQIISSSSYGANTSNTDSAKDLLQDGRDDDSTLNLNSALSKGTDAIRAFLKGMEEANMLLPKDNKQFRGGVQVNQMVQKSSNHSGDKKRYNRDNHTEEEIRTGKAAKMIKDPEENCANEMLDEMMLHAYDTCIKGMGKLHVSMDTKVDKGNRKKYNKAAKNNMVDIRTLLISCAQAVATNNHMRARELLMEIKQHASATGDATQRVALCFTKGLEARLVGAGSLLWEDVRIEDLNTNTDEVLVVNDLFSFSTLMDESVFFDRQSPRDTFLSNIKKMRPDVFIQSILNCSCGSSFVARFREVMSYYTALFDILDATMPRESKSRVVLEQFVLGRPALNIIACEGLDLAQRPEKYRQWQVRNQRAGLRLLPLKSRIVEVVKDAVQKHHHKNFLICEDGHWLLQGWKGRILFAHSCWWVAQDTSQ
ncbi:scarecrow-like protein 34 [Panicum virgatum]|uniref:scarecrow-like protein 34 n=1 Tax=Panicum virgatum TaxID=38727 RepID=UPI0019D61788|nr:scarecrow-like protein 34 [Panicum virgatum]